MGECEDSGVPVGSILSGTVLETEYRRFGGSEDVRRCALCWRATAAGREVEEREGVDVEVSGVGWGIVIPEVTISLAMAESGEITGMRRLSTVVW